LIELEPLLTRMQGSALQPWAELLPAQLEAIGRERQHGRFDEWAEIVGHLPRLAAERLELNADRISVSADPPLSGEDQQQLQSSLQLLHPWRKGPFHIHGVDIDTEWRSDWKWQRLLPAIGSLSGRRVLDVGCGNGYHCWRMAGAGAALVIGIDPTQLFLAQFLALKHFFGSQWPVYLLPLGIEDLPPNLEAFDSVFSMGVLYHRRSPIDHLLELKSCLRTGGELLLETLVIEGGPGEVLIPEGRYAKMRNVWFIPSAETLAGWMRRCGFESVRIVDVTRTTLEEQRATAWMRFESLADFLDPNDNRRTIEGHPAPLRAILHGVKR
jgi:tRNA (mo5U34)-methyltransferase